MRFLRRRARGHDLTCQRAVELVTAYLDGTLEHRERARFEAHLVECPACTEHLKQIQLTIAVTGQIQDEDLDPSTREDLLGLYRRWRDSGNS
jgi:anti-sigma factor RsiW